MFILLGGGGVSLVQNSQPEVNDNDGCRQIAAALT